MAESKYTISPPPEPSNDKVAPQFTVEPPQFSIEPPQKAAPAFTIEPPASAAQDAPLFRQATPGESQDLAKLASKLKVTPEQAEVINHPSFPEWFNNTLLNLNKYAVEPFENLVRAGSTEGAKMGRETLSFVTGGTGSPEEIEKLKTEHPIGAGVSAAAGSFIGGQIVDPRNYPLFMVGGVVARPILQRLMSGGFGLMMGKGAIDQSRELGKQWDNITPEQRAEGVTSLILTMGMTGLAGGHAVSPRPMATSNLEDIRAFQSDLNNRRVALLNTLPPERQLALLQKAGLVDPNLNIEDALPSFARAEGGKLQIGADVGRLTSILGGSMYSNRGAPVVVKELLQNALDSVRDNNGEVKAHIDDVARTFTIKDTGKGMTPNEVYTVFTDIGASGKGEQAGAAGGFGLAKIATFMIPEKMTLRTIGIDENGQKWLTEFTSTPEDIVTGNITPNINKMPDSAITGTTIRTQFPQDPEGSHDKFDFYGAKRYLHNFLGSSDIPGAGIKFTSGSSAPYYDIEAMGEPIHQKLFTVSGPGGEYEFSIGKSKEKGSNWPEYEVHNQGLYQFKQNANVSGGENAQLPKRIVVNIKPNVKEGSIDYPFGTSRETISNAAKGFIDNSIDKKIIRPQVEEALTLVKAKYNNMPMIETADGSRMPIYDSGARLTDKEMKFIQSQPVMKDLAGVINSVAKALQEHASNLPASMFGGYQSRKMGATIDRFGLLLADTISEGRGSGSRTYGVYVPSPHDPQSHATVFINPFGWAALAEEGSTESLNKVVDENYDTVIDPDLFHNPEFAASQIYHTITHEIVHDAVKGHNESFTTALMNLDSFMGMNLKIGSLEDIANAFRDPNEPNRIRADFNELLQIYRESRGRPENEKDILGGESLASGPEQPEQGPEAPSTPDASERGEETLRSDRPVTRGGRSTEADVSLYPVKEAAGGTGSVSETGAGGLTGNDIRQKLTQLVSMIPNFPTTEGMGGVKGDKGTAAISREGAAAASLDNGVGIGSVGSRPPVISESADRELANGGVTVVRGGSDIGIIARYLGSLSQSARRLGNPLFSEVAGKLVDTAIAISRNTRDAIVGYRKEVRANVNKAEWDQVVNLLNDPAVNKGNLPHNIPSDIRDAYNYTRDLLDSHRVRARDAKREEMVNGGMTRTKAMTLIPDDWGIKEGYFVHAFPGNWTINEMTGVDAKGNPIWEPIDTGWRQITLSAAQAKAAEYVGNNPNAQLKVQLDTVSLPGRGITDRNRLQALHEEIKNSSVFIHHGAAPDGVMSDLKDISSRLNFGPRRPAPRMFGPTLQRESNLPGWARDMDNFERYIIGMERYIELAPARAAILEIRNKIAHMSGMPDVLKPGELPKRYSGDYANTLGRLDASIEALEGYPTGFDAAVRNSLQKHGYDPNLLNSAYSTVNSLEALLKLGFNPASAGLHLAQTIAATYPVLGEKWTGYGILQAYSSKYDSLVHDLGIEASSNLMDLDTFQAYKGGYLSNISGPVTAAKAGFAALRDTGLFMFSKGVETARRIAAIGGYEKALSEGMNPIEARNAARDALVRTQFLYAPVDSPIALRNIPRPMGQFKNFTFKMMEFVTGLRGTEIPRFLVAMGLIGYSGFPALNALSNLTKWLTGYDPDNEFKRAFPRFSRGILGYAGIDYTKNIGFSDWLGDRSMEPSTLLGPGGSDIENIIKAAASYAKGPSREGEQDRNNAIRNISPEARRIWDEGMRLATKPSLIDPRTGSTIVKNMTPTERIESLLGLTPLRVAEEKESHEYIRNQIEQMKDKRGYFVDRLAEMEVSLSNPALTENDRMQYVKEIIQTAKQAQEYGVASNLTKAVRERAKEMIMERLQRDIKKAPKPERFPAYQEYQRFKAESQPPE